MNTAAELAATWDSVRNAAGTWNQSEIVAAAEIATDKIAVNEDPNFWALALEYFRAAAGVRFCGWETAPTTVAPAKPAPVAVAPLTPGFYTVEFEGGEYVTLRIQEDFRDNPDPNCRVAGFLSGSDNTGDYTGFAFVVGGQVRTWKRWQGKAPRQHAALSVLMGADDTAEYGKAYARRSGNCYRCNRVLTTPESIAAGIGPVCAGKE